MPSSLLTDHASLLHRAVSVPPGLFEVQNHFYPRVPNAQLHALVRHFLSLGNERIAQRYCHLHPEVEPAAVREALAYAPRYLRWAGADLLLSTTDTGRRGVVVIEVNSCPSGQKSMPLRREEDEHGSYRLLLERSFLPMLKRRNLPKEGALAVLWDKNPMETTGYAATLADLLGEPVWLVHCPADVEPGDERSLLRVEDGVLEACLDGAWTPLKAAFRYVTQRPWTRIPPITRTVVFNPVLACLAGGRNKLLAAKAYDLYNGELHRTGMRIRVPETIRDVAPSEVPAWVARMGGKAVVKNPYSNAGQGVYTIVNEDELAAFMALDHRYDRYIVQALIGNAEWSSTSKDGRLYHVGTVPNRKGQIYAYDLRFMVGASPEGFYPLSLYARRAHSPLQDTIGQGSDSWSMLGTNLSVKNADGSFSTEPDRLLLMDRRDFNELGIGLDDLTEAYLQTVLSVAAIDRMAQGLVNSRGTFRRRHFLSVNPDPALAAEIL